MSSQYGSRGPVGRVAGQRVESVQQYTPEQMELFKRMFSQVSPDSYTSRLAGGDESLFSEMEAPAMRQFSGLQGGLASRFSGMGMGGRRSSGFQNTATQASSDFAQDLQSRRQGLQRQALQDLMGMSNTLLGQRPYEQYGYEEEQPFWKQILGGALPIAGGALGGFFGGTAGAKIGGKIGSAAGKAFI